MLASGKPVVSTGAATGVNGEVALGGTVDPNGLETKYYFEYGPTASYGSKTAEAGAGSGVCFCKESATVTGLEVGKEYHFRIVATNSDGTSDGADKAFTVEAARVQPRSDVQREIQPRKRPDRNWQRQWIHVHELRDERRNGLDVRAEQGPQHHVAPLRLRHDQRTCSNTGAEEIVIAISTATRLHPQARYPGEEDGMRLFPASGSEFAKFECRLTGTPANIKVRGR